MSPPSDNPPESTRPDTLGRLIRLERERQGLSLRQLASLVGVQASAVILWERDETVPKAKYLPALARVLEVPTTELMSLSGADYPHDAPSLPAMLRAEYDLPPEAIDQVERYVARLARKHGATKPDSSTNQERRNS